MDRRFYGEFRHSVDPKGRLILPAQYRDILGDHLRVARSLDHCLCVYTDEEWEKFEQKLNEVPDISNPDARRMKRFFLSGSALCELDKQGRFLLPIPLRTFAGIDKDVVLAGTGRKIEIWDQTRWEESNDFSDLNQIASSMKKYEL